MPPDHVYPVLILRTDGASRGNPGHAAAGIVIEDEAGAVIDSAGEYLGIMTNNQAEYRALLLGLTHASVLHPARLIVRMDSELVVKQMQGKYQVKSPDLAPLHQQARALAREFAAIAFEHVRRGLNARADALANRALDEHLRHS
jgi:ribonuclease HI